MPSLTPEEFDALLRNDFASFVARVFEALNPGASFKDNWHIRLMASKLQACANGQIRRLIINLPPRHLKSIISSVALPLFILGHNPSARIMCLSYGQELAEKFGRDRLIIMRSKWYQELFPHTRLASDRQTPAEFATTRQGYCIATSIGGPITGRGANFIIVDDPQKPDDALSDSIRKKVNDYFSSTLYSRLDDKARGCIIIVMQRLHIDDLTGHVLQLEAWDRIVLPAIAQQDEAFEFETFSGLERIARKAGEALHHDFESLEIMENTRNRLGPYYFDAQYLQDPSPLGGGLVKEEWFRRYLPTEKPSRFEQIVQSWDTAAKPSELSNYSVCTTWGIFERRIYLLDVYRQRLGYPGLKQTVKQLRAAFEATVILIEDKSSGTALIQELVAEGIHGIQPYKPEGDKIMRMSAQTGTIQSGMVYIPLSAAWLRDYLAEATTFPAHRFSDQVDSTSQALDWIKRNLNNGAEAILTWAKGLAMRRYAHVEPKLVRVMAPPDMQGTEFYVGKSRRSLDSDRKSLVTAEEAEQLLKNGWMRIQ